MLCFISKVFVLTLRTFRVIEIVYSAAVGASPLRGLVVDLLVFREEKLELAALGTNVYLYFKRTRQKIRQIAEDPAGLTEL